MRDAALERVRNLVDTYGPRLTGGEAAAKVADELKDELGSVCDTAGRDSFEVHPGAFLGWIRVLVVLYPLSLLLMFLSQPLFALLFLSLGIYILVREFFLYHEVTDRYYPSKEGINVFGVIEPEGEAEQTLVYSGHHDSAPVFTFFTENPHLYLLKVGGALGSFFLLTVLSFAETIAQIAAGTLFSLTFPSILSFILLILLSGSMVLMVKLWNFVSKEGSPGAGDNLISSSTAVELARYFAEKKADGNPLGKTRLVFASFDSEEAGLRGSRHFFSNHAGDLIKGKGYHFNVECLYDHTHLSFLTSDVNGSVQLSQQMATKCVETALSMGYQAKSQKIAFLTGGTDAAESAKAGLESTTLIGMPWKNTQRGSVYHTPEDTVDHIDEDAVEQAISIAIRFIENLDRN